MKNSIFKYCFVLAILCFINIPIVFSKEVIKTCRYEGDIVFEIYDDDSKPYTDKTIAGEKILNWGSNKYEYDAKKDFEETKRCPLYVIDLGVANTITKYVFSDAEHKSDFREEKAYIYALLSSNPKDKYKKGDPYACEYDGFSIEFDSNGYAVDITNPKSLFPSNDRTWNLDESLTKKAYSPGKCQNVYFCTYTSAVSDGVTIETHMVGSDSMALAASNKCIEKDEITNFEICEDGENCNGSTMVCGTYSELLDDVKESFNCTVNDKGCLYDSTSEDKLKSLCNSVLANSDYTDSCLQKCLGLKDDISYIKNKDVSNNRVCGFSEKLILYIANIVKWGKYLIPVVVIVLGILDFIKAIGADKDDEMKKAQGRFVKRLIAAALIFILPFIIEFVLDKMGFGSNGCGIIDL